MINNVDLRACYEAAVQEDAENARSFAKLILQDKSLMPENFPDSISKNGDLIDGTFRTVKYKKQEDGSLNLTITTYKKGEARKGGRIINYSGVCNKEILENITHEDAANILTEIILERLAYGVFVEYMRDLMSQNKRQAAITPPSNE